MTIAGGWFGLSHSSAATPNPLSGAKLAWTPATPSSAANQATAWRSSDPAGAAMMDQIAAQPMPIWFGEDWEPAATLTQKVSSITTTATKQGAVPVLVTYSIPRRDCGSYSSGGSTSIANYKSWIDKFAAGLGGRRAIVVEEPDALTTVSCLSSQELTDRMAAISYATTKLKAAGATVYLDAGNPGWNNASTMQTRLQQAGVAKGNGFALNVSNFYTTATNVTYGTQISNLLGGTHFIVDTSRNGLGGYSYPATGENQWCNPPGRALGTPPAVAAGNGLVDAYLWIKVPGESDGECTNFGQNDPPAGTWNPSYALGLAQRASWIYPDLTTKAASVTTTNPTVGQTLKFGATISNAGTAATPPGLAVGVSFTVDGVPVGRSAGSTLGNLVGGGSRSQTLDSTAGWVATVGTHTLVATVDDGAVIPESNESNNSFTTSFTVAPAPVVHGLTGSYYTNNSLTALKLARTDSTVNFNWGTGSPASGVPADNFSARWTGNLTAPTSGTYTFYTTVSDGVRLWVNGSQLVNDWKTHSSAVTNSATVTLVAGQKYPVTLEYYEATGSAKMVLEYKGPSVSRQVVPSSVLTP